MAYSTDRRTVVKAIGAAAVAAGTADTAASAEQAKISGQVTHADGVIPAGILKVSLNDNAAKSASQQRLAEAQERSSGKARSMRYQLDLPRARWASANLEIVAQLEREDGWLLARGSTDYRTGASADLTIYTVMY